VRWHLDRAEPGTRVGHAAHNNHTAEMFLAPNAPGGFTVADTPLGPAESGSVEAASFRLGLNLIDLRAAPRVTAESPGLNRIRSQSSYLHTSVPDAFDAILTVTIDDGVPVSKVQRVVGHERSSTTLDFYTHRTDDRRRVC
jgi:hypothetical protein